MKIGIMTLQGAKNSGAVLQAYALSNTISNLGHEVDFVNFISDGEFERNKNHISLNKAIMARKLYYILFKKSIRKRNKLFETFSRDFLKTNPSNYRIRENELPELTKSYDCLVCGSDQIWSQDPKLYDKTDAYFINFPYEGKKISYAASFGDRINHSQEITKKIITNIEKFDNVSVREEEAMTYLKENGIYSEVVVDPTLLIKSSDWEKLAILPEVKEKYILYFSVNSRKYSINIARHLAKKAGLKVVEINPHPKSWNSGFEKRYDTGPREFLGYILNAEYIVTNSFHGTVFSILFNKKFIAAFDQKDGKIITESRKESLLNRVGLDSVMKTDSSYISLNDLESIKWNEVNKKIADLRSESIRYLVNCIGDKKNDKF